jgi:hypothetical protein
LELGVLLGQRLPPPPLVLQQVRRGRRLVVGIAELRRLELGLLLP